MKICFSKLTVPFRLRCDHDQRRVPFFAIISPHFDWMPSESPMYLSELARNLQALIHSLSLAAGDDDVSDIWRRPVDLGLSSLLICILAGEL